MSYTVVAGSTSGASNIAEAPVGTATSLTAAVAAGRYFVRVRAVTPCGGADSNEIELIVGLPQLPGAPVALTHQVAGRNVSLVWQAPGGAVDGYVIEAGSQPALSNLAVIRPGNVLSFSAADVQPGTYSSAFARSTRPARGRPRTKSRYSCRECVGLALVGHRGPHQPLPCVITGLAAGSGAAIIAGQLFSQD